MTCHHALSYLCTLCFVYDRDVEVHHLNTGRAIPGAYQAQILYTGPLQAAIEFRYRISDQSHMIQTVSLSSHSQQLEFQCTVDWKENNKMMKVEFPVNILSHEASFQVQYGHVSRAVHNNTAYDIGRFESVAHGWFDISESEYGVAVFTDCKYGTAVHGNAMRLSLLRSPQRPDPLLDRHVHEFKYALYPHAGTIRQAQVVQRAQAFSEPVVCTLVDKPVISQSNAAISDTSLLLLNSKDNCVVVDCVKNVCCASNLYSYL